MASTFLTRTVSGSDSTYTYKRNTVSVWLKRSGLGNACFFEGWYSNAFATQVYFLSSGELVLNAASSTAGSAFQIQTNKKFRDVNSWYNIVISIDTTDVTSADRCKIYVNGVRETSFSSASYPNQNASVQWSGTGNTQFVGRRESGGAGLYYDGAMSYLAYIDGTAELPTIFGETDTTTGQWKIKTDITPSVAWGNFGFLILKNGNSLTDESTNTNNFTLGSGTLTNTLDCPSNVFATLNSLLTGSYASLSNGNNTLTGTSSANNAHRPATLQVGTSGKYYYEVKITANENGVGFEYPVDGVVPNSEAIQQGDGNGAAGFYPKLFFACNGRIERSNLGTGLADLTGLTVIGSTGIKMFAIDMDNGAIYIGANGAWLNNGSAIGVPSSGSSKTGAMWGFNPSDYPNIAICSSAYDAAVSNYNFGNGYFGTSAVTSAGTAGSTPGVFEYDVPSGYEPLTTKGLNA